MEEALNPIPAGDVRHEIPDGEYMGLWSGYTVQFLVNGVSYTGQVNVGARGINIPCVVTFLRGKITLLELFRYRTRSLPKSKRKR